MGSLSLEIPPLADSRISSKNAHIIGLSETPGEKV